MAHFDFMRTKLSAPSTNSWTDGAFDRLSEKTRLLATTLRGGSNSSCRSKLHPSDELLTASSAILSEIHESTLLRFSDALLWISSIFPFRSTSGSDSVSTWRISKLAMFLRALKSRNALIFCRHTLKWNFTHTYRSSKVMALTPLLSVFCFHTWVKGSMYQ